MLDELRTGYDPIEVNADKNVDGLARITGCHGKIRIQKNITSGLAVNEDRGHRRVALRCANALGGGVHTLQIEVF